MKCLWSPLLAVGSVSGLLFSCSSSDEPGAKSSSGAATAGYLSGSRLRAGVDLADQAKSFTHWRDTTLNVDCEFRTASDGATRCMPMSNGYIEFGDAACTTRVAVFYPDTPVTPYIVDPAPTFTCGMGDPYRATGATVSISKLYYDNNGTCMQDADPQPGMTMVELGDVVDPTTFAEASPDRETRDDRLSANVLATGDGARQVVSFYDLTRAADCATLDDQMDHYACVPTNLAYIERYFADDACLEPVAYHPGYANQVCMQGPTIVLDASGTTKTVTYYEVGAKFDGSVYEDAGMCQLSNISSELDATFYAVGAPAPWSSFPPLTRTDEGEGRIKLVTLRGPTGDFIASQGFFDSEKDTLCYPQVAADQKQRCLPATIFSLNLFADDQCTQALMDLPPGSEAPVQGSFVAANTNGGGRAVFTFGTKITPPATVWQFNADCQPASVAPGDDVYDTVPVLPSAFVEVTSEVE
ncbi:MAG TPA: hypothetical protein VGP93_15530 [Polyangiaceae bacterium]|nr:hypothetical protein [Polyangiaceae bacterium]